LASTVEQVLVELAEKGASGCLTVTDPAGEQAEVYYKDGSIYSVFVPGRRAQLGARLIASGDLSPEALASALDVQTNELQGWRLGELLVHLGYVERPVVESFVIEQLRDAMAALLEWPVAAHKFRKTKKTRQDVAPPMTVRDLLAEVEMRRHRWTELTESIGGERGVPMLSARPDGAADVVLSSADWALLCKVDGTRDIAGLAAECGFTVFEAAHVVKSLMDAGLVDVELPDDEPVASVTSLEDARGKRPAFEPAPDPGSDELAGAVKKVTAALEDLFKPVTAPGAGTSLADAAAALEEAEAQGATVELPDDPEIDVAAVEAEREARETEERLASEVEAWLEHETWLAEQAKGVEADAWLAHYQWLEDERRRCEEDAWLEHEVWVDAHRAEEATRLNAERKAMEHKAWKEHKAWLITERKRVEGEAWDAHQGWMDGERDRVEAEAWDAHELWLDESKRKKVERLAMERKTAEAKAWKEHKAWLTAERKRVEGEAWTAHAEWLDAERVRVEGEAWPAHAEWLEDERAAFEADAWTQHAEWLDAERVRVEDEAWTIHGKYLIWHQKKVEAEAWTAHAQWLDAERVRVEGEAWATHAEVLAEEERQRAEAEAQRAEAERLRAEAEAARIAAARAEQDRFEEEARAEEERRRRRQEEADRAAVEAVERAEAERIAAEEAARAEAERIEAERIAAEQAEVERIEAERIAAEEAAAEAARLEAERIAAEHAEAQRLAAEQAESDRLAAEAVAAAEAAADAAIEHDRQRIADEMAAAEAPTTAASFADLGSNPIEEPAEPDAVEVEVVEDYGPEPSPAPEPSVDTAALLRELASLGGFGDQAADTTTVSAPVKSGPVTKDSDKKKKKGLFGR
jgi:hypothetical protein